MAEMQKRSSGDLRQPSRLQRRAPASIQINRVTDWNVAIPLLSPLVSPTNDLTAEIRACGNPNPRNQVPEPEKPTVFKKWQHPAAPFCYESAPMVPFVCARAVDRSRT